MVGLVLSTGLGDQFVSQNPRKFYRSHYLRQILICAYILYYYQKRFSFSVEVFPSYPSPSDLMRDFFSMSLEVSVRLFLFSF